MYYHYVYTEIFMKKTVFPFLLTALAAFPLQAQSTCETRVDKHQDATTRERVAYCLTPEAAPSEEASGPELVYYGVSTHKPAEEAAESSAEREPVFFEEDNKTVAQDYVGTRKFPTFANDILSEQDRLAKEQAQKAALEKAEKEAAAKKAKEEAARQKAAAEKAKTAASTSGKQAASGNAPLSAPSVLAEVDSSSSKETAKGISARRKKPARYMKQAASFVPPASPDEPALPAEPTDTPLAELEQAEFQLEDTPVNPSGTAGGAAPDGFLDNDLISGQQNDFGYNATDPAYQP